MMSVLIAAACAGCGWGTNAIRISSIPDGAKVYVNGEYKGETPRTVPSKCWWNGGETVQVRLEKEGYRTFEKSIPWADLYHRWSQGDCTAGSEFGNGATFPYTFHLEKATQ
jgi:hypothetical protein